MNRKSTLNQKRSATISEFRFITEENTEANALLQQEQQQPQLKQDQSLLQQHKRTQSQTKLTKVLPYKVTRSKSVHAFQEYGKGFVGSPLMNSSIKSSQINLPQSKKLIKTNNTFATNSSNNFANSIPQQPSTSIAVASEELRLPVPPHHHHPHHHHHQYHNLHLQFILHHLLATLLMMIMLKLRYLILPICSIIVKKV